MIDVLKQLGFPLCKFASNSQELLSKIKNINQMEDNIVLFQTQENVGALGLSYSTTKDILCDKIKETPDPKVWTKWMLAKKIVDLGSSRNTVSLGGLLQISLSRSVETDHWMGRRAPSFNQPSISAYQSRHMDWLRTSRQIIAGWQRESCSRARLIKTYRDNNTRDNIFDRRKVYPIEIHV